MSSPAGRTASFGPRPNKENSRSTPMQPRSVSQGFARPRTPMKTPQKRLFREEGLSRYASPAQKPRRSPSAGMLGNTTNLPCAIPRRSPSLTSIASPRPMRSPVVPAPSPTVSTPSRVAACSPRRISAPATPDRPSLSMCKVPVASPRRLSCPSTPTGAPTTILATPSPSGGTCRTPGGKTNRVLVALRIRPIATADRGHASQAFTVEGNSVKVACRASTDGGRDGASSSERIFNFDHVIMGGQQQVYTAIGSPLLQDALQGYNVCLFAYGQTGSGKTHSLQGTAQDEGIVPRMMRDLFVKCDIDTRMTLSLFEIYNEKLRDLLAKAAEGTSLDLFEDQERKIQVRNLSKHSIVSVDAALQLVAQGNSRRQVGFTMMNHQSSRSHLILQLTLAMRDVESVVTIVDLAGSDRASKTEATGDTFRESKNINQSLLMLGRSLNSMSEGHAFVPSRDSKVTRLLSAYLQGNCKTALLATVSPVAFNLTESVCTMEFAQNAAAIKKMVKVNSSVPKSAMMIKDLKTAKALAEEKCATLEAQLQQLQRDKEEAARRCEELCQRVQELEVEKRGTCRLSMDMLTDDEGNLMLDDAELKDDSVKDLVIAELQVQVEYLTQQNKTKAQQLDELACEYERLNNEKLEVTSQRETADRRLHQLEEVTVAELQGQVAQLKEELNDRAQQFEVMKWDYERLSEERNEANLKRQTADTRLVQLEEGHKIETEMLKARCGALQLECDTLRAECSNLQSAVASLEALPPHDVKAEGHDGDSSMMNEMATQTLTPIEDTLKAQLQNQVAQLQEDLATKVQQLDAMKWDYERLCEEQSEANIRRQTADNRLLLLEASCRNMEGTYQQQISTWKTRCGALQVECDTLRAECSTLHSAVASLEALPLHDVKAEGHEGDSCMMNETATQTLPTAEDTLKVQLQTQVAQLREDLAAKVQQLDAMKWDYERLCEEQSEVNLRRQTADNRLLLLEASCRSMEVNYQQEIHTLKARCEGLQSECDARCQERDAFRQERDVCRQQQASCCQELEACRRERDACRQDHDACRQECDACRQDRDACRQERDVCRQECNAYRQERDICRQERDACRQELNACRQELDTLRAAAAATAKQEADDEWLASNQPSTHTPLLNAASSSNALAVESPWGVASGLQRTPLLTPASHCASQQATPCLCSQSRACSPEVHPGESICISSDSDSDIVVPVRTAVDRRATWTRTTMVTRSCTRKMEEQREQAEQDVSALRPGCTLCLMADTNPPADPQQANAARQSKFYNGTVTAAYAQGIYLIKLRPMRSKEGAGQARQLQAAFDDAAPPTISRRDCIDCSRRFNGYHMYTKAKWSTAQRRCSTTAETSKYLGQQWRGMTAQAQERYNRLAEEANEEMASPLCKGTYKKFAAEQRQKIKGKNPRAKHTLVERKVSAMWKTMSYAERAKYSFHTPKCQQIRRRTGTMTNWKGSESPEWPTPTLTSQR